MKQAVSRIDAVLGPGGEGKHQGEKRVLLGGSHSPPPPSRGWCRRGAHKRVAVMQHASSSSRQLSSHARWIAAPVATSLPSARATNPPPHTHTDTHIHTPRAATQLAPSSTMLSWDILYAPCTALLTSSVAICDNLHYPIHDRDHKL